MPGRLPAVRISIRVYPGAARPSVGGVYGDPVTGPLIVRVAARAVDGKATEAALQALADVLGVPRRDLRLLAGQSSRDKVVEVRAVGPGLESRLAAVRTEA